MKISDVATSALLAILAGGGIRDVLKEELPKERGSRFTPFLLGAAANAGLLPVRGGNEARIREATPVSGTSRRLCHQATRLAIWRIVLSLPRRPYRTIRTGIDLAAGTLLSFA